MPSVKVTLQIVSYDNFTGHSPARFGVGEELKLSVAFADKKQTAATVGGLEWKVKSGPAILKSDMGNGNATLKCGGEAGTVELELRLKTGSKELLGSKKFVVVEPASATFVQKGADYHIQGVASAGFLGEIMLHPDDVSFKWVEIREGGASYSGSRCFELKNVKIRKSAPGEFKVTNKDGTVSKGSSAVIHPIMGEWVGFGKATGKGTKCVGADTVLTSVPNWGTGGDMTWAIPWFFRVPGSAEKRFLTAVHEALVDAAGKCTISKLGHTVTKNLNDGDSNVGLGN
jgi:hypothetical protein